MGPVAVSCPSVFAEPVVEVICDVGTRLEAAVRSSRISQRIIHIQYSTPHPQPASSWSTLQFLSTHLPPGLILQALHVQLHSSAGLPIHRDRAYRVKILIWKWQSRIGMAALELYLNCKCSLLFWLVYPSLPLTLLDLYRFFRVD